MTEQRRTLAWDHGTVSVESLGGMLGPTTFVLPDGRQRDGGRIDVRSIPLPQTTEEIVQLLDMPGQAALWNAVEGCG